MLDTSKFPKNMVLLNVYDVSQTDLLERVNRIATANNSMLIGGVFHAGVEVYGKEWSYGATDDDRSGVGACWPRTHPQHTYRATVPMGETSKTDQEVVVILRRLAAEWPGNRYDLIHNNCLSFCNVFLEELGQKRVPGWVDRAARVASNIDKTTKKISADTKEVVQLVRTVTADLEEQVRGLAEDETRMETFDNLRRHSVEVVATASKNIERHAEVAQARAQELAGRGQELAQEVKREVQDSEAFKQASELGEAVRGRLLQWGQAAAAAVAADDMDGDSGGSSGSRSGPGTFWSPPGAASGSPGGYLLQQAQANLDDLGKNIGNIGNNLGKNFNDIGLGDLIGDSIKNPATDTPEGADTMDLLDVRNTAGLVRASEDRFLERGLLDEDDDDDDLLGGNGGLANMSILQPYARQKPTQRAPEAEAPMDWMTSPLVATPVLQESAISHVNDVPVAHAAAVGVPSAPAPKADVDPFDLLE